jgi:hypothetical protein
MGAWGIKNFENDSALDWLGDFSENQNAEFIEETLLVVLENEDYLEVDDCSYALAAAEILAALNHHKSSDFPEEGLEEILSIHVENLTELKELAKTTILKIKSNSELKELWEESEEYDQWVAVLDDLGKRLS